METRLAQLAFQQAHFYDRQMHPPRPDAAQVAYRDFVRRYPDAERVADARARMAELEPITGTAPHENNPP